MAAKKVKINIANQSINVGKCVLSLFQPKAHVLRYPRKTPVTLAHNIRNGEMIVDRPINYMKYTNFGFKVYENIMLDHSPRCPCHELNSKTESNVRDSSKKTLSVAACVLVLDSEFNLLLTRRSTNMSTFPKAWVNPGGKIDFGETLEECALRELNEETGLEFKLYNNSIYFDNKNVTLDPFYLYESVYPTKLSLGLPTSQTICLFFALKLQTHHSEINLKICKEECDAYIWKNIVELVHEVNGPTKFSKYIMGKNINNQNIEIPIAAIQGVYPNVMEEGLGQGHILALEHYISMQNFYFYQPSFCSQLSF